jgi:hypothetical protein
MTPNRKARMKKLAPLVAALALLVPAGALARGDQIDPGGGGPFPCQPGNGSIGVTVYNIYPYGWGFRCGLWPWNGQFPPTYLSGWGWTWNIWGSGGYYWKLVSY